MKEKVFRYTFRVPYAHIDKMGFVYYSNYLIYFEMARAAMLREVELPYAQLEERGIMLPVLESHCNYRKPAYYDDLLLVESRCSCVKGTRLHVDYEVFRLGKGIDSGEVRQETERTDESELICTGHTDHVCMTVAGKVVKLVDELTNLFNEGVV